MKKLIENKEYKSSMLDNIDSVWNLTGIYIIRNKSNNKVYIGQSKCIGYRWWVGHILPLRRGNHHNIYLQRSWLKYGEENFEFQMVEECDSHLLNIKEEFYIKQYSSLVVEFGYNIMESNINLDYLHSNQIRSIVAPKVRGENNYLSSLTEVDVVEIKTILKNKSMSVKELSQKFNVSRTVISNIKNGYNWRHVVVDGFVFDRTRNRNAVLSDTDVIEVKKLLSIGVTHDEIKEVFNVSESYISKIHRGVIKSEIIVEGFKVSQNKHKKLTEEQVVEIKLMLKEGELSNTEIANIYNVNRGTISDIKCNRRWRWVSV